MTFEQYWAILVKQWRLLVICFVVVGLGAFVGSKLSPQLYQSASLVQVTIRTGNNPSDYNNLLASDQLVQTEAELAISDPVLREVASHFSGMTVEQLAKVVTSTPKLNTQLFEIDVLAPNPKRAADIANDIARTLIKQQLDKLHQDNAQSQQQLQQDLDLTSQRINTTTNQIAALQAKNGNKAQIAILQTQLSSLQQHYNAWQTLLAQLELAQAQNGDFLSIVQPAQPGISPVQPNVLLNTAGGLLTGLLLGILLALIYERLDTRVRNAEALTQLMQYPVLATVWRAYSSNKEDVINPKGRDVNVEPYRILRTNIGFSGIDKPLHTLMVSSALPRDGKSAIAANLAIFMAKAGKPTLLIDADLHRPTQHTLFGLSADKMGLSNAILAFSMPNVSTTPSAHQMHATTLQPLNSLVTTNVSLEPFVHSVGISNLRVMPSGPLPPNPSELLDSKAMQHFFTVVENAGFEVVIFDSPPLLGLSDGSILASKVDGTLLVIDITRANKRKLKQMKAMLTQTGAHVLGCLINKQRRSRRRRDSSYDYYYYQSDDQNGRGDQSVQNFNSSPVQANGLTRSDMQSN